MGFRVRVFGVLGFWGLEFWGLGVLGFGVLGVWGCQRPVGFWGRGFRVLGGFGRFWGFWGVLGVWGFGGFGFGGVLGFGFWGFERPGPTRRKPPIRAGSSKVSAVALRFRLRVKGLLYIGLWR